MNIFKIISGGQTGADRGGLEAGKRLGLDTGGTCPAGYRTENGRDETLLTFGVRCHKSRNYPPRTEENVINSDATLIFGNPGSRGSQLTQAMCRKHKKPCLVVFWTPGQPTPDIEEFIEFLYANDTGILNVAGNRESTTPGICYTVQDFLMRALGSQP